MRLLDHDDSADAGHMRPAPLGSRFFFFFISSKALLTTYQQTRWPAHRYIILLWLLVSCRIYASVIYWLHTRAHTHTHTHTNLFINLIITFIPQTNFNLWQCLIRNHKYIKMYSFASPMPAAFLSRFYLFALHNILIHGLSIYRFEELVLAVTMS